METLQRDIEQKMLNEDRRNLVEVNEKLKRKFMVEIEQAEKERLDELQIRFYSDNPDISFEEILLIKKVFDYLKGNPK